LIKIEDARMKLDRSLARDMITVRGGFGGYFLFKALVVRGKILVWDEEEPALA
jgi:hypothetical protein